MIKEGDSDMSGRGEGWVRLSILFVRSAHKSVGCCQPFSNRRAAKAAGLVAGYLKGAQADLEKDVVLFRSSGAVLSGESTSVYTAKAIAKKLYPDFSKSEIIEAVRLEHFLRHGVRDDFVTAVLPSLADSAARHVVAVSHRDTIEANLTPLIGELRANGLVETLDRGGLLAVEIDMPLDPEVEALVKESFVAGVSSKVDEVSQGQGAPKFADVWSAQKPPEANYFANLADALKADALEERKISVNVLKL